MTNISRLPSSFLLDLFPSDFFRGFSFHSGLDFLFADYDKSIRLLFPSVYAHGADTLEVRMAVSRNGRNFQWVSRDYAIGLNLTGLENETQIYANPSMVPMDDHVAMLLEVEGIRHDEYRVQHLYAGGLEGRRRHSRLALWEKDRLSGLVADSVGEVFTGMTVSGKNPRLQLNLRAKGQGRVRVELLQGQYSKPVEGFELKDSTGIGGDSGWTDYCWNGSSDLSALAGKSFGIRIQSENAKLFGWRLVADED